MATVIYYEDRNGVKPVKEFLNEIEKQSRTDKRYRGRLKRILSAIRNLEQIGYRYVLSSARDIKGVHDLWELRPAEDRVFFFLALRDRYVLLHAYEKKTQKTPPAEIARAEREIADYLSRGDSNEPERPQ